VTEDEKKRFDNKARHQENLQKIGEIIAVKGLFEKPDFQVKLPRESAQLETLTYGEAESKLLQANDNYIMVTTYLAQAEAAEAYFHRFTAIKEKQLIANMPDEIIETSNTFDPLHPEIGSPTKMRKLTVAQKEARIYLDANYKTSLALLTSAEEIVAYLRRISDQTRETLQVIKKVRDAAWERSQRRA
jgi:hypothetical protein